ncbi:MAG: hypothetical protein U1F43_16240 [Myxococcota bacterium]
MSWRRPRCALHLATARAIEQREGGQRPRRGQPPPARGRQPGRQRRHRRRRAALAAMGQLAFEDAAMLLEQATSLVAPTTRGCAPSC